MHSIIKYLYQIRLLIPKEERLNKWIADSNLDDLQFAAKIGDYKIRLLLIDKLSDQVENKDIQVILIDFVNDKVPVVSKKAISILKEHQTMIDSEAVQILSEKEKYWIEEEKKPKPAKGKVKYDQTWRDNEDKMVRLKQVRQQLKKSMYGERWM